MKTTLAGKVKKPPIFQCTEGSSEDLENQKNAKSAELPTLCFGMTGQTSLETMMTPVIIKECAAPATENMTTLEKENVPLSSRLREMHLFAGCGGGVLGGILLGHTCVCAVEIEPYCRKVLFQRQRDGILPRFPIWDDIKTFDGKPWRGLVDVVCGGFPCQDISSAGKGAGIEGSRSGLWSEMARVVRETNPRYVLVENSPMLTIRGLGTVLRDLAKMGRNARWGVFSANDVGAPHKRDRIFILSDTNHKRQPALRFNAEMAELPALAAFPQPFKGGVAFPNTNQERWKGGECKEVLGKSGIPREPERVLTEWNGGWSISEPITIRVDDGSPTRVDETSAIGNAQVPAVAALAWNILQ